MVVTVRGPASAMGPMAVCVAGTLDGKDPATYATELAHHWGVGDQTRDTSPWRIVLTLLPWGMNWREFFLMLW